jgi:hypothetical protein
MTEREQLAGQEASDANAEVGMLGEPLTDAELTDDELVDEVVGAVLATPVNSIARFGVVLAGIRRLEARLEQNAYNDGGQGMYEGLNAMYADEAARVHP